VVAKTASDVIFEEDLRQVYRDWQFGGSLSSVKTLVSVVSRWLNVMTRIFLLSSFFYYGNLLKTTYYSCYTYLTGKKIDDEEEAALKVIELSY
jgi:hypothetical protein